MEAVSPVLPGVDIEALGLKEIEVAKDQPQYRTLPSIRFQGAEEPVVARFRLTWKERLRILLSGNIWLSQLTFGNAVTPVLLEVEQPKLMIIK